MNGEQYRSTALDSLRGLSIFMMTLSGTITFGILPSWMYHAQSPPPDHKFSPEIYGITWVDLVFPIFIFAMGAAFAFSLGKRVESGESFAVLLKKIIFRTILLTFFAIFIQHMYPWSLESPEGLLALTTPVCAFILMYGMFSDFKFLKNKAIRHTIRVVSFIAGGAMLYFSEYSGEREFSLNYSNIIILVLANMALFGSLIYIFTVKNQIARVAVLPLLMALILGSTNPESWNKALFDLSPVPWFFKFNYLKYLFILIPGTIAGDYLKEYMSLIGRDGLCDCESSSKAVNPKLIQKIAVCTTSLSIVVINLCFLHSRLLLINLGLSSLLLLILNITALKGSHSSIHFWRKMITAATFLLILGLFFEAFEGGIRKDYSTFSYYFVTTALSFLMLLVFIVLSDISSFNFITHPLTMVGRNPMVAYVASSMVIIPLLKLSQLYPLLDQIGRSVPGGMLKGLIITSMAMCLAFLSSKFKIFWRT